MARQKKSSKTHAEVVARIGAGDQVSVPTPKVTSQDLRNATSGFPLDFYDLPFTEPRCKVCKQIRELPEIRKQLNYMLVNGFPRVEVLNYLAECGIETDYDGLSRHYRQHVWPYLINAITARATTSVYVEAAMKLGKDASLAEITVNSLLLKLQAVVESLDEKDMQLLDPKDRVELLLKATRALASIKASEASTALRGLEIAFRNAKLSEAERQAMARARAEMGDILRKQHPDLWKQIEPILAAAAEPPALPPAGDTGA